MTSGRALMAGYEWRQRFVSESPIFPTGSTYTAHVRRTVASADILATLTTANGGVSRVNDFAIELVVPGSASVSWEQGPVVCDVVRTDVEPDQHLGWRVTIPVVQPVTRL